MIWHTSPVFVACWCSCYIVLHSWGQGHQLEGFGASISFADQGLGNPARRRWRSVTMHGWICFTCFTICIWVLILQPECLEDCEYSVQIISTNLYKLVYLCFYLIIWWFDMTWCFLTQMILDELAFATSNFGLRTSCPTSAPCTTSGYSTTWPS